MTRRLLISALALVVLLIVAAPARAQWRWPVAGTVITSYCFGGDPYAAGQHRGIDIAAGEGAPVVAATPGEVRFAGTVGSSGLTVGIRTADGRYDTSYLHLSSVSVREGQRVAAGQRVGAVGTSGERPAARPHLHFGVRDAGTADGYHDPLGFLPPAADAPSGPRGAPIPHAVPVTAGRGGAPHQAPVRAPHARPAPGPLRAPLPQATPGPRAAAPEPTFPGWAIACAAVLAAAALIGRTPTARTRRRRIAALLKPRLEAR